MKLATRWAQTMARDVSAFLLPSACAVCRELHTPGRDGIVCVSCLARIAPLPEPLCARCGHSRLSRITALATDPRTGRVPLAPCRWCERLPSYIRTVRSVGRMDAGTGSALVHALKYGGWSAVAVPLARRMARLSLPPDVVRERTALVPIPLSSTRERERGYNQAERLAAALAEEWRIPVWRSVLRRTRETQSQVRLTPSERVTNVSHAFETDVRARSVLEGAHVVLVDDVITTAATVNSAASALFDGGARIISCVTFGRAPEPGDRSDSDFDPDRD